jgi:hypothetical protein
VNSHEEAAEQSTDAQSRTGKFLAQEKWIVDRRAQEDKVQVSGLRNPSANRWCFTKIDEQLNHRQQKNQLWTRLDLAYVSSSEQKIRQRSRDLSSGALAHRKRQRQNKRLNSEERGHQPQTRDRRLQTKKLTGNQNGETRGSD